MRVAFFLCSVARLLVCVVARVAAPSCPLFAFLLVVPEFYRTARVIQLFSPTVCRSVVAVVVVVVAAVMVVVVVVVMVRSFEELPRFLAVASLRTAPCFAWSFWAEANPFSCSFFLTFHPIAFYFWYKCF